MHHLMLLHQTLHPPVLAWQLSLAAATSLRMGDALCQVTRIGPALKRRWTAGRGPCAAPTWAPLLAVTSRSGWKVSRRRPAWYLPACALLKGNRYVGERNYQLLLSQVLLRSLVTIKGTAWSPQQKQHPRQASCCGGRPRTPERRPPAQPRAPTRGRRDGCLQPAGRWMPRMPPARRQPAPAPARAGKP